MLKGREGYLDKIGKYRIFFGKVRQLDGLFLKIKSGWSGFFVLTPQLVYYNFDLLVGWFNNLIKNQQINFPYLDRTGSIFIKCPKKIVGFLGWISHENFTYIDPKTQVWSVLVDDICITCRQLTQTMPQVDGFFLDFRGGFLRFLFSEISTNKHPKHLRTAKEPQDLCSHFPKWQWKVQKKMEASRWEFFIRNWCWRKWPLLHHLRCIRTHLLPVFRKFLQGFSLSASTPYGLDINLGVCDSMK